MTAHHDPDRAIRAWLDLMPDEAPYRTVAAVLQAVEATPQQRRPRVAGRWRFPPMSRFAILGAAAALVVVLGSIAFIGLRPPADVPIGAPSPFPSATATPTPPSASPSATPDPTAVVVPLGAPLRSQWLADVDAIDGLSDHEPRVRLVIGAGGRTVELQTNRFGNTTLSSIPVAVSAAELRLVTDRQGAGCDVGDEGTYRWTISDDGVLLDLEPIADACATRAAAFGRTWTRSLDAHSTGGRGVVSAFDPRILVTLPEAPHAGQLSADVADIGSITTGTGLYAVKDPWGLAEPCSEASSTTSPLEPGLDPFVAHLRTLPGARVATEGLEIDGHRAVQVTLSIDPGTACDAPAIDAWTAKNVTSGWRWSIAPGETASVYAVELPGSTYVLQYYGDAVTTADERQVMASVRFVTTLPPTP